MPPKAKKVAKPRGSNASNAVMTSAKDMSTSSNTNLQTKDNYSVFILNTQTDGAQSILREFVARAKERKRNVVVPIVLKEIEKEISLEKASASNTTKDTEDAVEESNAFSYHATPDEIFQKTKIRITECIEQHDSFLAQLNSIKKLDLLQYWELTATTAKHRSNKNDAKIAPSKKSSTASKETKAKDKQVKVGKNGKRKVGIEAKEVISEYEFENCKLEAIPVFELNTRMFSRFSLEIHGSRVLQKYIADHPEDGPLLYILIIGTVYPELCLSFLREKYPLHAIFSVCPSVGAMTDKSVASVSDILMSQSETKPVNLQNITFPTLSKCDASRNGDKIYNELCWLLYDVIILKRQHVNFLANLKEIDVDMRGPSCHTDIDWEVPGKQTELNIILLYLEGLLSTVAASVSDTLPTFEIQSLTGSDVSNPLVELYGKKIVEYRNQILRNSLSNNCYDKTVHPKIFELLCKYSIANLLWRNIDSGVNGQRFSWDPSGTTSRFESKSSNLFGPDISLLEVFTENTMVQRINYLNDTYDFNCIEYCQDRDELDICFYNHPEQYFETTNTFHIPSSVCFRDFCRYVAAEIHDWVGAQGKLCNEHFAIESVRQSQTKVFTLNEIDHATFLMDSSLKTKANIHPAKNYDSTSELRKEGSQLISNDILINTNENHPKYAFPVYNIGDTRYHINSTKAKFKTTGGSVHLLEDKFASGELLLQIDMDYFGDHILHNHTYPSPNDQLSMKIICTNSSIINFWICSTEHNGELRRHDPLEFLESDYIAPSYYFEAHLSWPTGLRITTYCDKATGDVILVEQSGIASENAEVKRLYYPDGKLVIYYTNDFVDILTPSGVLYEAVKFEGTNADIAATYIVEQSGDEIKLKQNKYMHEIATFEGLQCEVFKGKFKLNTPDGYVFDIFGGSVMQGVQKQHLTEWYDFALGERYAMLEEGVKTRLCKNKFEVLYRNGTFITTVTEEDAIDENLSSEEATPLGSLELVGKSDKATSAAAIAGNLVDKILDNVSEERYISCNRTYLIQHADYAMVHFGKDEVKISCPDETHIILKSNELQIDIKSQLRVNCNPKKCIVRGCKYPDQNNYVEAVFNFDAQTEPLLTILSGVDSELQVTRNGARRYRRKSEKCPPKFINPIEKRIIVKRQLQGYEIHSRREANAIKERAEQQKNIILSNFETMTILQPVAPLSGCFNMPTVGIEEFLKKFIQNDQTCTPILLASKIALEQIPDVMTVRVLLLAPKYFRRTNPSTAEILSTSPSSLEEVCYESELGHNTFRLINQEAKRAIDSHLAKITPKDTLDAEMKYVPSRSSLQYKNLIENQTEKKKRKLIYQQIIRNNFWPKYADFKKANCLVVEMNVLQYQQVLNELDGMSPNTNLTSIHRLFETGVPPEKFSIKVLP